MPPKAQPQEVPVIHDPNNPQVPYTQPIPSPNHPHARYEYQYGNMHRCHLCDTMEAHLENEAEGVWFASLEDKCRHIIECHRDFPLEVSRAEEILGITNVWDRKNQQAEENRERNLFNVNAKQGMPVRMQKENFASGTASKQKSWFKRHPKLTIVLLLLIGYVAYCLYLVMFQGYTF